MRSTAELTSGKVAPMSVDCGSSNSAERSHWLAHTTVPGLHVAYPLLLTPGGPVAGTTVAAAGGHGMMWGPGVAKAAADVALTGVTDVVDVADLGLDRFDEQGRSRLAPDPIALPFPESAS